MLVNWGIIVEEVGVMTVANIYDTAKLYKLENVSLGAASTVKLVEEDI